MDYGYNRNRPGGNERVIPISFDGGRQPIYPQPPPRQTPISPSPYYPSPPQPYYPSPPAPPSRPDRYNRQQPDYPRNPGNAPGQPSKDKPSNQEFSDNELDEMDAVAEALKRKRAAEGKGDTNPSNNVYRPSRNINSYASDPQNSESPHHDIPDQPPPTDNIPYPHSGPPPNYPSGDNFPPQSGTAGFVLPPPLPNSSSNVPYGGTGVQNLPYPSGPQYGGGGGGPGYPAYSPNFNQLPPNPTTPYPAQQSYYPPNPY